MTRQGGGCCFLSSCKMERNESGSAHPPVSWRGEKATEPTFDQALCKLQRALLMVGWWKATAFPPLWSLPSIRLFATSKCPIKLERLQFFLLSGTIPVQLVKGFGTVTVTSLWWGETDMTTAICCKRKKSMPSPFSLLSRRSVQGCRHTGQEGFFSPKTEKRQVSKGTICYISSLKVHTWMALTENLFQQEKMPHITSE